MSTKSEVVFQRALHFKDQICDLSIKHIEEQEKFRMVVCEIFGNTFRDETRDDEWDGENERRFEERRERRGERDRRDDNNDNCNPM